MVINGVIFNVELIDIITELQSQLHINGYNLLNKIKELPDDIMVTCVYHKDGQESKPSAGFKKADGVYHCFTCNETHSLQEVITYCFGHYDDMIGAFGWNWLLKNFVTLSVEERKDVKLDFCRDSISVKTDSMGDKTRSEDNILGIRDTDSDILYITEEELDKYRYYHSYWDKRGITDDNIIELFDLGYDKQTDCITFPIRDVNGRCLFVARRSTKTKYFHYPTGSEKPLYGIYELYQQSVFPRDVIVCESMLDALVFWQIGKYALALNGTGTALQFKQLRELPCRALILCTDMDEAGMKARRKIKNSVRNKLIYEYMLPEGRKDANECTQEELKSLKEIIL